MITDVEFIAIREFDKTLDRYSQQSTAIINRKNALLVSHAAEIARLRAALAAETGKRRMAELQLAQARRH